MNLTDAVKLGRAAGPLLEALEAESRRRDAIRAEFAALDRQANVASLDGAEKLRARLRASVENLEGFLGKHVPQTRQVLKKLLRDRLHCEAFDDGERRGYRFSGEGSYDRLVPDLNFAGLCGDPGGIRTRDLDLERVASWARLDDGVSARQYT